MPGWLSQPCQYQMWEGQYCMQVDELYWWWSRLTCKWRNIRLDRRSCTLTSIATCSKGFKKVVVKETSKTIPVLATRTRAVRFPDDFSNLASTKFASDNSACVLSSVVDDGRQLTCTWKHLIPGPRTCTLSADITCAKLIDVSKDTNPESKKTHKIHILATRTMPVECPLGTVMADFDCKSANPVCKQINPRTTLGTNDKIIVGGGPHTFHLRETHNVFSETPHWVDAQVHFVARQNVWNCPLTQYWNSLPACSLACPPALLPTCLPACRPLYL